MITVYEQDLEKVEPGEYDVLEEWKHIDVRGTRVQTRVRLTLRRVG